MARVHVTARAGGLLCRDARGERTTLRAALGRVPAGAPVAILVHGYRFRADDPARDPHGLLYGGAEAGADWPSALGFSAEGRADGLCLGFGWDAWAAHGPCLLREGRSGFAAVYERAAEAGEALGALLAEVGRLRPDLEADVFAHSLGARVALAALSQGPARRAAGRLLLLGAAEDAGLARARLPARQAGGPQVYHMAARHNDAFDALFEVAAPRVAGRRPVALGRAGLGEGRPDWIDLQLDRTDFAEWAAARGVALGPVLRRVCHWSFYARQGAMDLYRAILRERASWSIAAMRAAGAPEGLLPRRRMSAPVRGAGRWPVRLPGWSLRPQGAAEDGRERAAGA